MARGPADDGQVLHAHGGEAVNAQAAPVVVVVVMMTMSMDNPYILAVGK
jgi:hypothetical protein